MILHHTLLIWQGSVDNLEYLLNSPFLNYFGRLTVFLTTRLRRKKKIREGKIGHKIRPQRNKFSILVFGWRVLPETIWVKNPGKRENGRCDISRKSCVHTCAWAWWEQFLTLLIMVPFLFFLIHHPLSGEDFTACSLSFLFFSKRGISPPPSLYQPFFPTDELMGLTYVGTNCFSPTK